MGKKHDVTKHEPPTEAEQARTVVLPPASALMSVGQWANFLSVRTRDANSMAWLMDLDRAIGPALLARDNGGTPIKVVKGTFPGYCLLSKEVGQHLSNTAYEVTHAQASGEPKPQSAQAAVPLAAEPRDEADVFINAALDAVKPKTDLATVWATLQTMARSPSKPGTLLGVADGKLQYSKGGEPATLSRDALSKRLKRRRSP